MNKRARRVLLGLEKISPDPRETKIIIKPKKPKKINKKNKKKKSGNSNIELMISKPNIYHIKGTKNRRRERKSSTNKKTTFRSLTTTERRRIRLKNKKNAKYTYYYPRILKSDSRGKHSSSSWVYHRLVMKELHRRPDWRLIDAVPARERAHISNDPSKSLVAPYIDGYLTLYSKWELGKMLNQFHGVCVPETHFIRYHKYIGKRPKKTPGSIWFLKPTHLSQGKGIHVSKNPYSLLKKCTGANFIVQKAVSPLLLYEGRKYDLRMWMLFVSPKKDQSFEVEDPDWSPTNPDKNLQVFLFKDGVVRITLKLFESKERVPDLRTHLTNYAYQSQMSGYTKDKCVKAFSKMPYYNQIYDNIKLRMREMTPHIMKKLRPDPKRNQYWLAGIDFVIDKSLNPWLLEMNCNPGVSCITRTVNIYRASVPNMLDLAIIPLAVPEIAPKLGGWTRIG